MFYQKYSIMFFLFFVPFLTITHPFYKTMSEEAEHTYNQLKEEEEKIIDDFKKKYPKIPDSCWENVKIIAEQKKVWLSDFAPENSIAEEPHMKEFASEEELKEYCARYIEYECIQQGINPKKIKLTETSNYDLSFSSQEPSEIYITEEGEQFYCINSQEKSEIRINPEKFIKNKYKQFELSKALFLQVEAFHEKEFVIKKFITHFYNSNALKSDTFSTLRTAYLQKHTNTASGLAQLLSKKNLSQKEIGNTSSIVNKIENNDIDDSREKNFKKWLKKIIYLCTLPYDPFS